jgi:(4-(4-[2-(gamma-L-glutamylamino)ethyl]phenoxymethyl)furan-2-yl)methanamine synthase
MVSIIGWDIGGANVKAAWLSQKGIGAAQVRVESRPFEIWREKDRLPVVLEEIYRSLTFGSPPHAQAVTMTAELSDIFKTKREGVLFVLECIRTSFPVQSIHVLGVSGDFSSVNDALLHPPDFAATNWVATVRWIAPKFPNCLLIDAGSTTTDILTILDGKPCVTGRTDLERLSSGELVFTGALRTNLAAIVQSVPVRGRMCRVASEYFAISGDIHLILGHLQPQEYTCTTPDGQPPSLESARRRLARLVCADSEMISTAEIDEMARYIYCQQIRQIREGMEEVISRSPVHRKHPVLPLGMGAFLGSAAAESIGLDIAGLEGDWGREQLAVAPCLAAAHLLAEYLEADSQ